MASIANDPNGRRRVLFVDPNGERKALWLGKVSQRAAEVVKFRVEQLLAAKLTGHAIEADTARWAADFTPTMAGKLARVGLIPKPDAKPSATLGAFISEYLARRTDVKAATLTHWGHTARCLLDYFGTERLLANITAGEAKDFERWLRTGKARLNRYAENEAHSGLALNTARKRISNAKQFFADAVAREIISRNPFAGLKGSVGGNREREHFIDRATAQKVLDACPDAEWRLLFALSRYGGLRCPSEHLALKWGDIDWAGGKLLVRSSKTEHHEGKGERLVPLFPELRLHLETVFDAAEPGTVHVITRYRDVNANLRTQLERILRRAGVAPWPKLFQNLRASRATELANQFPAHVAAAWLGHSTLVAQKHYWQVTDADFVSAVSGDGATAQKTAQHVHAEGCGESQAALVLNEQTPVFPGFAVPCEISQGVGMGDKGLERVESLWCARERRFFGGAGGSSGLSSTIILMITGSS